MVKVGVQWIAFDRNGEWFQKKKKKLRGREILKF